MSGLRDNKSFILVKPNQIARFKSLLVQEQSLCFSIWDRRSRARACKKTAGAALVDPRQSWILESTLWNPDSFWIPCPEQGFRIPIVCGIPDPKSWNTDSKAQHSGFHKHNFSRFRIPLGKISQIPDNLTWSDPRNEDASPVFAQFYDFACRAWHWWKKDYFSPCKSWGDDGCLESGTYYLC